MAKTTKQNAASRAKNTVAKVEPLIAPLVREAGYFLWDIDFFKEGADFNLLVTIENADRSVPIGLEDCEKISRLISPELDEADPIQDPYTLEVSSPGMNRPLRTSRHFELCRGEKARISLFAPVDGKKQLEGTILSSDEKGVVLQTDCDKIELEYARIARACLADDEE